MRRAALSYDAVQNNTRAGKGAAHFANKINPLLKEVARKYYVVVDKREFKCELPSRLFHFGFEVVPRFLELGDYLLSDMICIERKSVATHDLQESLRSGRLNDQLKRMTKQYQKCFLLIEFAGTDLNSLDEGVTLEGVKYKSRAFEGLMAVLARHPGVQILWSLDDGMTCELFKQLKKGQI